MNKEGCENKSALFNLLIFHLKITKIEHFIQVNLMVTLHLKGCA